MGAYFKIPAFIIYLVSIIWGSIICFRIVSDFMGSFEGWLSIFPFFPVTLVFAPWYEGLANANWLPLVLIHGGLVAGSILYAIGAVKDRI